MRLGEEEFWLLTIREFNALSERYKSNHDWQNYRAALICSVLANIWRDPKKRRPFTPDDFMPKKELKQQSPEQMLMNVKLLNAAFGGKVVEK